MTLREAVLFGGLALALHLGAIGWIGADMRAETGGSSGGAGGEADVTVLAAPGEIAALVARWTAPPEVATGLATPAPSGPPDRLEAALPRTDATPRRVRPPDDLSPAPARSEATPDRPAAPRPAPSLPAIPENPDTITAPSRDLSEAPRLAQPAPDAAPGRRAGQPAALPSPPRQTPEAAPDIATAPAARPTAPVNSEAAAPRTSARPALRPAGLAPERPAQPATRATPAPRPAPQTSQGATSRTARGTGDAPSAGQTPPRAQDTGLSPGAVAQARAQWGGRIRNAVARAQRYPRGSRATGQVVIRLRVAPAGRLMSAGIVASSGDAALDRAALEAARRARLPAAPRGLTDAGYSFDLPLNFARR